MNIILVGAGEVGYHLARFLSAQDHDVVVIDVDRSRLARIEEQIDVTTLCGDATHLDVLKRAEVEDCDLLVAVSNRDNVNLVAARLGRALGASRTVVRTSHLEAIISRRGLYRRLFDVNLLLSTQLLTTSRILELVRQHHNQVLEEFLGGKVQLRRVTVESGSSANGVELAALGLPRQALVAALFRDGQITVPRGDTMVEAGDQLLVAAVAERMPQVERHFSQDPEHLGTVVVAGGGETAVGVCRALLQYPVRLKVIERDKSRCQALAQALPRAIVLLGRATETELLKQEYVDQADQFLALTGDDETNVVASLLARDLGVKRVVTMIHRPDMLELCRRMRLGALLSPRMLAAERIQEYIKSGFISNIATVAEGRAEVFERVVDEDAPIAGKTLAEVELPGALVVAMQRGEEIWVPHGGDVVEPGDLVVFFSLRDSLTQVVAALEPAPEPEMD